MHHPVDWEDDEATSVRVDTSLVSRLKPIQPRIRIIGMPVPALPLPLGAQQALPAPRAPRRRLDAVSVGRVVDVGAADTATTERGIEPQLTVGSALLDWDDAESNTDVIPAWDEQDEVTMPVRFYDQQVRARLACAALSEFDLAEGGVDLAEGDVGRCPAELPQPAATLVGFARSGAEGDTLVEQMPPSEVQRLVADEQAREARATESAPTERGTLRMAEPISEPPETQPSTPMPAVEPLSWSEIDIDLTDLERSRVFRAAQLDDLADDDDLADHTPAPLAQRMPASLPLPRRGPLGDSRGDSLPPMTVSDRPPSQRPPRRFIMPVAGGLAALCCALVVMMLWPREGSVVVKLQTADGKPASRAEIYVDGQKRCDTDPCVVRGLGSGDKTVKVIAAGLEHPQVATAHVRAGEQVSVTISLPAVASHGLTVSSRQAGLRIEVDGSDRGALPVTLTDLSPGEHELRFSADGYAPQRRMVTIVEGERLDLGEVALVPTHAKLLVDVATDGARVVLVEPSGDKRVLRGPWPMALSLEPGRYKLAASQAGFEPWVKRYRLAADGESREARIELAPKLAPAEAEPTAEPTAEPQAAEVMGDPYEDVE